MEVDHPSATNEEDGVENDNHVSLNITESLDRMQKTLTENIMSLVFTLRAKKNVPYSVSHDIVRSVESFMSNGHNDHRYGNDIEKSCQSY